MPDPHDAAILSRADDILVCAGGLVLLTVIWRHRHSGWRDPLRGSPVRPNVLSPAWVWLALVGYLFSAVLAGFVARLYKPAGATAADLELWRGILTGNLMLVIVVVLSLWIGRLTFFGGLAGFGLRLRSIPRDAGIVAAGWLIAMCLCTVVAWASEWAINRFAPERPLPSHNVLVVLEQAATPLLVRMVAIAGALLLAPLGEELLFRGILQSGIRKLVPPRAGSLRHRWVAIVVTAALFGAMHLATYQHVAALTVFGVILGYLYERTGSLWVPVLVHVLFNGKTLLWYFLQA